MPVKGAEISFEDIGKLLGTIPMDELEISEKFLIGDHWQKGDGWIGWTPEVDSPTHAKDYMMIEKGFTPKNVIKGMVWRLRGAVLGKEPDWEIVGVDAPEPELDPLKKAAKELTPEEKEWKAIDDLMTDWWTNQGVHDALKTFATNYTTYGKAALCIYIPSGYVKEVNGKHQLNIQDKTNLADVLSKIFVYAPHYSSVINAKDEKFGKDYVCLSFKKDKDDENSETVYEVHYLDEKGNTHLRQVQQAKQTAGDQSTDLELDLGGNLLTFVAGAFETAMISLPVKSQQRQLNHAKTMEGYSLGNLNFPETTFINASLETEKGKGPDGNEVETVKPLYRGIGRFLSLVGVSYQNADGSESVATPDVKYKTPADPEKFAKVAENNTRDMHQEAGMLYILLSSSPYPSGDARVESMTDYLILLVDYKTLMDTLGVWLLSTVLRLAFNLSGQQAKNDKFKVIFSTKLTIGRMSVEDRRLMLEEVKAELRSKRNYIITAEVSDDPNTELKVIAAEPPTIEKQTAQATLENLKNPPKPDTPPATK